MLPKIAIVLILRVVEEIHLQERDRHRVDRWPPSHARHAMPVAIHLDHEDAGDRRRPAQHDVGGRKAQPAAELRAVRHAPADGVRMAEQPPGAALETRLPSNSTSSIACSAKPCRLAAACRLVKLPARFAP